MIECPLHGGRFSVRTGHAVGAPADCPLQTMTVRVVDDHVDVLVPSAA